MKINFLNHGISNVHAAALILGAAGLLSRILGILRDRMLASRFGAGRELDIYYAAFQVPDFMSALFLLGAGSAAILPVFQEYLARDRNKARQLISSLSLFFLVAAVLFSLVIFFAAPIAIKFIVPGFSREEQELTVFITRILLLSPVLLGFSSIFSAVVQSFEQFLPYALAPIFYNLGIIAGIIAFVPFFGVAGLGGGVVLGALLHFAINFFTIKRLGFAPKFSVLIRPAERIKYSMGVKEVIQISFPRALSISLSQLTILILIALGSTLGSGSISVFQFAQNLYFLPIGIFGVSYATAIFPRLSRSFIAKDAEIFFHELFAGIRNILFWIVPSAVLFIVLRAHVVRLALGAGRFNWEDTRLTAAALAALTVGMAAGSLIILLLRGFYSLEKTWRPLVINLISSLSSILLAYFLVITLSATGHVGEAFKSFFRVEGLLHSEVIALALGYMIGTILNTYFLYASLMRLAENIFGKRMPFPMLAIQKIIAASAGAGFAAYAIRLGFQGLTPLDTFFNVFFQGVVAGFAGVAVYIMILFLLRSDDIYGLWRSLERRLFRIGILPKSWDGYTHGQQ